MPHNNRLPEALNAFLKVSSLKELENVLKLYPELLREAIDSVFAAKIEKNRHRRKKKMVQFLQQQHQKLHNIRFRAIHQQAEAAEQRYLHGAGGGALDEAIALWEKVLQHPNFATAEADFRLFVINNSAGTYLRRYWARGDLNDLSTAIKSWETVVATTPPDSPDLPGRLNNLGTGLRNRYARLGDLQDLQAGIAAYQQAVATTPPLPMSLNNLGTGLRDRYARLGDLQDLQAGIAAVQQAVATTPPDSPDLPMYLNNLGTGLSNRYARLGDLKDLQAGIEAFQQAVATTPPDSPNLPALLNNLGNGLRNRYARLGDLQDLQAGIAAFQQATELGKKGSLEEWLRAARNGLNWADERNSWEEMEKAYPSIQEASRRLIETQLLREHQEAFLPETEGLAIKMAHARIQTGQLRQAVEALEQGIARLLSAALMLSRTDLSQLQQDAPEICTAYQQQLAAFQNAQRAYHHAPLERQKACLQDFQAQRMALDQMLEDIRRLPGHEDFLLVATNLKVVYQAAQTVPLVYLFATDRGGYALLVFQEHIQAIPLPELIDKTLKEKVAGLGEEWGGYLGAYSSRSTDQQGWFDAIEALTQWLWSVLWQPLSEVLLPSQQRLTLIPIGWLTLLPLHAAWRPEASQPTGRRYVLDDFIMTYAPNAFSLQKARERMKHPADRLLAIDEPKPVHAHELSSSRTEVDALAHCFTQVQLLRHEQATIEAVKQALHADHTVLHFACHGSANLTNPLKTSLLMAHDQSLTVQDFFNASLQARLVTLSACETGLIGTKHLEEVVGLPASLLQAGAAGVVASLWSVNEVSTAMLMVRFYTFWQKEGLDPAEALQRAQQWVRDTTPQEKQTYFEQQTHLPQSVVEEFISDCELDRQANFQHPFYWAAFGCYGV